jgi:hypothetical protein
MSKGQTCERPKLMVSCFLRPSFLDVKTRRRLAEPERLLSHREPLAIAEPVQRQRAV